MKPALIFGIAALIIIAGFLYYSSRTPIEIYTAPEVEVVKAPIIQSNGKD